MLAVAKPYFSQASLRSVAAEWAWSNSTYAWNKISSRERPSSKSFKHRIDSTLSKLDFPRWNGFSHPARRDRESDFCPETVSCSVTAGVTRVVASTSLSLFPRETEFNGGAGLRSWSIGDEPRLDSGWFPFVVYLSPNWGSSALSSPEEFAFPLLRDGATEKLQNSLLGNHEDHR